MKDAQDLWLVSLFYGQGASPTGVFAEGAAHALEGAGYRVTVLTSQAAYNGCSSEAAPLARGRIKRLSCRPVHPRGIAGRALSWATFALGVAWVALVRRPPAVALVITTPPLLHVVFVLRNMFARRKARILLWSQDTFPDILAAVGLLPPAGLVYRSLHRLQRWATSRVTAAAVLDEAMARKLREHGARRITVAPNWEAETPPPANLSGIRDILQWIGTARERFRFVLLYLGNYGWGHNLSPVTGYLRDHPGQTDFCFLGLGGGEKWPELLELAAGPAAGCVRVRPYVARDALPPVLQAVDFGLVTLEPRCAGLMSPSKIHTYLAAGKPLLYLGPPGSNVDEAISMFDCGWRVPPDDPKAVETLFQTLARGDYDIPAYAARARRAYTERYCASAGTQRIVDMAKALREARS